MTGVNGRLLTTRGCVSESVQIQKVRGAQGRDRTTDTCIFSAVLYQLSYLGVSAAGAAEAAAL